MSCITIRIQIIKCAGYVRTCHWDVHELEGYIRAKFYSPEDLRGPGGAVVDRSESRIVKEPFWNFRSAMESSFNNGPRPLGSIAKYLHKHRAAWMKVLAGNHNGFFAGLHDKSFVD